LTPQAGAFAWPASAIGCPVGWLTRWWCISIEFPQCCVPVSVDVLYIVHHAGPGVICICRPADADNLEEPFPCTQHIECCTEYLAGYLQLTPTHPTHAEELRLRDGVYGRVLTESGASDAWTRMLAWYPVCLLYQTALMCTRPMRLESRKRM
jgi:hypothetical protein